MVEGSIHFFTQRNVTFIHKNAPEKTQETASKKRRMRSAFRILFHFPFHFILQRNGFSFALPAHCHDSSADRGFQRFLHNFPLQAGCEEMAGHGIASRSAP